MEDTLASIALDKDKRYKTDHLLLQIAEKEIAVALNQKQSLC